MKHHEIIIISNSVEAPNMMEWDNVYFCGTGKVNAAMRMTEILMRDPTITKVWNFGTARGITVNEGFHCCNAFIQGDMNCTDYEIGRTPFERLPTNIVTKKHGLQCNTRDTLEKTEGMIGDVMDMEAYALAKVCLDYGVEFECWKFIDNSYMSREWLAHARNPEPYFIERYYESRN